MAATNLTSPAGPCPTTLRIASSADSPAASTAASGILICRGAGNAAAADALSATNEAPGTRLRQLGTSPARRSPAAAAAGTANTTGDSATDAAAGSTRAAP